MEFSRKSTIFARRKRAKLLTLGHSSKLDGSRLTAALQQNKRKKIMEATTRRTTSPVAKVWNMAKDLNGSQKLELVSIIIDSLKTTPPMQPYTMDEINAMLDEAEAAFEAGEFLTQDEVFHPSREI